MGNREKKYRDALSRIAEVAGAAGEPDELTDGGAAQDGAEARPGCVLKSLPTRLLLNAAKTALKINPVNGPVLGPVTQVTDDAPPTPMMIAVMVGKYWGPTPRQLTVTFMEATPADLRARIVGHLNAWATTSCVSFVETQGTGDVRLSRGGSGYWSYLGTDILHIPKNRPTMNLQGFTMATPESEYRRVIRHEAGHTLGFPHEHMRKDLVARIDRQKAYAYFLANYGWDKTTVDQQVLTALDEISLIGTPVDQTSIMCYQLPGSITKDGLPITGGDDINGTDYAFAGRIYPKPVAVARPGAPDEWPEAEDVDVVA